MSENFSFLTIWRPYIPLQEVVEALEQYQALPNIQYYHSLPYQYLHQELTKFSSMNLNIGVSEMTSVEPGSFTEMISSKLLQEVKAQFVLLGSRISRFSLGENAASIQHKLSQLLSQNIRPFVFVCETPNEFQEGQSADVIKKQLEEFFPTPPIPQEITLLYDTPAPIENKEQLNQLYALFLQTCQQLWGERANDIPILLPLSDKIPLNDLEGIQCSGFFKTKNK